MAAPNVGYSWRSVAAGAAMGLTSLIPGGLAAQETQVAYVPPVLTEALEAEEDRQFERALEEAGEHAITGRNHVGIVFQIGDDLRAHAYNAALAHFEREGIQPSEDNISLASEALIRSYVDQYRNHYADAFGEDIDVEVHSAVAYHPEGGVILSGVSYYIGDQVYRTASNTVDIPLGDANTEIGRVRNSLPIVWRNMDNDPSRTVEVSSLAPEFRNDN
ncbi:MAG: hypothetical protein AB8B83_07490 [Bdellovibrionales bacterium]